METKTEKKIEKKKGFFAKIMDKMDKNLENKAKKKKCSCCDK